MDMMMEEEGPNLICTPHMTCGGLIWTFIVHTCSMDFFFHNALKENVMSHRLVTSGIHHISTDPGLIRVYTVCLQNNLHL